ncbi:MAG: hypothetical protein N3A69_13815, partial [Leptospiraceae bacterium]|nr:hypothetical protein [Leptospiraceae bacterium]
GIVHGRDRAQFIDFSMLKEKIRNKRFGIIFGREDTGIQKKVSELCDYMLDFDLKGSQKSMNLAQAVAYFLGRIAVEFEQAKIETIKDINIQKKDLLKYIQEVFSILEMNDFHGSENLATKRFRSLLRFSELTQGDINFLFKMLKTIENKIKNNSANEE